MGSFTGIAGALATVARVLRNHAFTNFLESRVVLSFEGNYCQEGKYSGYHKLN